jgi:cellobionic acid phosphorylase
MTRAPDDAPASLLTHDEDGARCVLHSPTALPNASAFLWNRRMMIQLSCRGYAVARHMQPEPAKYSHAPMMEAAGFMQPEQPYYAHHPGRFVYLRDDESGELWSLPHEPVRRGVEDFRFEVGPAAIGWSMSINGLALRWSLTLPPDDAVELWTLEVRNPGSRARRISLVPYFSIGYMSWMYQAARHHPELGAIVARSVTPYQKVEDYPRIATLKDLTFLLCERAPDAWETQREAFEGEGGLHAPDALRAPRLACGEADYETPLAAVQYALELPPQGEETFRFVFGPARDLDEIAELRARHLAPGGFARAADAMRAHLAEATSALEVQTPDPDFDRFVNHWLARQVYYHGDVNRLSTDPQTRNYLQDAMGMAYLQPSRAREAFLHALSQQKDNGSMPDGILLHADAQLKYINCIPHSDHCVWLPVCLQPYLDETGDADLLDTPVRSSGDGETRTVYERVTRAMRWLLADRDARGLSYIAQGDWCDPMNMVGYLGHGVSGWLTLAAAHALGLWAELAARRGDDMVAREMRAGRDDLAAAAQTHLWDDDRFARGITDAGRRFGIASDREGRLFLNPQCWAMLAGVATPEQVRAMLAAIDAELETPFGVELCAPAFTAMQDDIGRVTQKFPGSAENGAVYNHVVGFHLAALYRIGDADRAWRVMRKLLPGPDDADLRQRGQLPVFVPNYYRGAWRQYPRTAGRSSQLFNTGTASWMYRVVVEGLFGLQGCAEGLRIAPRIPKHWSEAQVRRRFRGTNYVITIRRGSENAIRVDGVALASDVITDSRPGTTRRVEVTLPPSSP